MSDFTLLVDVTRGQLVDAINNNPEQIAFVITAVLSVVCADDVIETGSVADEADPSLVAGNLRAIANAIENGDLS